jgi:hypothetical protein
MYVHGLLVAKIFHFDANLAYKHSILILSSIMIISIVPYNICKLYFFFVKTNVSSTCNCRD